MSIFGSAGQELLERRQKTILKQPATSKKPISAKKPTI
jgi:hypothetical protein